MSTESGRKCGNLKKNLVPMLFADRALRTASFRTRQLADTVKNTTLNRYSLLSLQDGDDNIVDRITLLPPRDV